MFERCVCLMSAFSSSLNFSNRKKLFWAENMFLNIFIIINNNKFYYYKLWVKIKMIIVFASKFLCFEFYSFKIKLIFIFKDWLLFRNLFVKCENKTIL